MNILLIGSGGREHAIAWALQKSPNTDVLYVTSLTDEDVATLDYFTQLKSVEAQECTDYAQLTALAARRPAVAVDYAVTIDGRKYDQDTAVVSVSRHYR